MFFIRGLYSEAVWGSYGFVFNFISWFLLHRHIAHHPFMLLCKMWLSFLALYVYYQRVCHHHFDPTNYEDCLLPGNPVDCVVPLISVLEPEEQISISSGPDTAARCSLICGCRLVLVWPPGSVPLPSGQPGPVWASWLRCISLLVRHAGPALT